MSFLDITSNLIRSIVISEGFQANEVFASDPRIAALWFKDRLIGSVPIG